MISPDPDEHARELAAVSPRDDDPTGWPERLYAQAADGTAAVPWDVGKPRAVLVDRAAGRDLFAVPGGLDGRLAEFRR